MPSALFVPCVSDLLCARPEEGSMRHIAFILDPDGYWIEVIAKGGAKL